MGLLFGKSGVDDVSIPMIDLADKLRMSRKRVSFDGSCVAAEGVCATLGRLNDGLPTNRDQRLYRVISAWIHSEW